MTRLTAADIAHIAADLSDYDAELVARTRYSLREIACCAAGISERKIRNIQQALSVSVIPVTGDQGIISGFCDGVANIISHIGGRAFVTQKPDVAGLTEAFEAKADIIILADDDRFVAIDIQSRSVVDNAMVTGKAYATGLSLMAGNLNERPVLVIGCGPVGCSATEELVRMGARVSVYDINRSRCRQLAQAIHRLLKSEIQIADELDVALTAHPLIVDASPAADIIDARHINPDTFISAPGFPCGLSAQARSKISDRMLHDSLQIGVAAMFVTAVKHRLEVGPRLSNACGGDYKP